MAITLETTKMHFIGLSTDTKPTGVPVGSTFLEYNSGQTWVCYDGTNWAQALLFNKWRPEYSLEDM